METERKTKIRPTREEYLTPCLGIINYFARTSQYKEIRQGNIRTEVERFNGFLKLALIQGSMLGYMIYSFKEVLN